MRNTLTKSIDDVQYFLNDTLKVSTQVFSGAMSLLQPNEQKKKKRSKRTLQDTSIIVYTDHAFPPD